MSVDQRLLLVTPDAEVGRALDQALGSALLVTTARSVDEALGHLGQRYYPVVLADYALAGRDGAWLLGEVKRLTPSTRRVLVSATAVPRLPDLRAEGVVDLFLPKPLDVDDARAYLAPPGP
jgi:DNA-binding NtrC family response regulator